MSLSAQQARINYDAFFPCLEVRDKSPPPSRQAIIISDDMRSSRREERRAQMGLFPRHTMSGMLVATKAFTQGEGHARDNLRDIEADIVIL